MAYAGVALSDYGLVCGATITTNGTALPILKRNNAIIVEPTVLMYCNCATRICAITIH